MQSKTRLRTAQNPDKIQYNPRDKDCSPLSPLPVSKHSPSPAKFDEIIGKEESDSMNSYQEELEKLKRAYCRSKS
ncbi:MAG: hypothetical protein QXF37_04440 [Archaeoglobaceae archaeon]